MATIGMNSFAKRHTAESKYSHFNGSFDQISVLAEKAMNEGNTEDGYRVGVILANVAPEGFYTGIVEVDGNTTLRADFEARREGEDEYIQVVAVDGDKVPAKSVQLVLYRKDVLAEDGDNSTDADWEIVSINASPTIEGVPIAPQAWARNALHLEGGTDMGIDTMSVEDLRKQLKSVAEGIIFWNTHVMRG